jgi:hypothetical protein
MLLHVNCGFVCIFLMSGRDRNVSIILCLFLPYLLFPGITSFCEKTSAHIRGASQTVIRKICILSFWQDFWKVRGMAVTISKALQKRQFPQSAYQIWRLLSLEFLWSSWPPATFVSNFLCLVLLLLPTTSCFSFYHTQTNTQSWLTTTCPSAAASKLRSLTSIGFLSLKTAICRF